MFIVMEPHTNGQKKIIVIFFALEFEFNFAGLLELSSQCIVIGTSYAVMIPY